MKKYNYPLIKRRVMALVKQASFSRRNRYKDTVWHFHILPTVEHSLKLGKRLKADLEVVELAALLHDLAALSDRRYIAEHHIHGAAMAGDILNQLNLPEEKVAKIKQCILNHRGSRPSRRRSREEKILASADAMSHFTELADMMYLTYGVHRLSTVPGAVWLKNKLLRSWKKIMPAGRKIIIKDYRLALRILNQAIARADKLAKNKY